MGIFDNIIKRVADEIVKAAPTATPISEYQMNPNPGYGNSVGLPRDPQMPHVPFTPGQPLIPGAINPVRDEDGRPNPRRYEYQVAQNINITETRLVPFKTLRAAADQIDILRRCVEASKNKLLSLDWDFVLANDALEQITADSGKNNVRAMAEAKEKFNPEITRLRQFWQTPDRSNGLVFADWLNMMLEDLLVLDAVAVWPEKTVGGDLLGLQLLDGATIKPLIDDRGMRPRPPFPAFQQILYGFPRSEFSAPTEEEEADGEFSADELAYFVRNRRTTTVYGYSPVERSLTLADIYLRRQQWLRAEYTDGVLPDLMFKTDATFGGSPDLLRAYENVLNDTLSGQTEQRKRGWVLPGGLEPIQFEGYGEKFKDVLDEYLVTSICGHFGIQPTEIGFMPKTGLGGKGFQEGASQNSEIISNLPLTQWVARQITQLSYVFLGMPRELEFKFSPSVRTNNAEEAQIVDMSVRNGTMSLNEARSKFGMSLLDSEDADRPIITLAGGSYSVTEDGFVSIGGATPATLTAEDNLGLQAPGKANPDGEQVDETEGSPQETDKPVEDTETKPADKTPVDKNKASMDEARTFLRWLRKSPDRPFNFESMPEAYAITLNKFVEVKDFDGARWFAERFLG